MDKQIETIQINEVADNGQTNEVLTPNTHVKQYVQLREQYKKLINYYSLDLSPNNYIIEQIKRFRSEKEDLKIKYETLRDEFDSLIEQHSSLKAENKEITTKYRDLQFYFNLLKNNQKEIKQ